MSNKRVQVTFTPKQWEIIRHLKGTMGETDSEVVRNLVLAWLAEKSIIANSVKNEVEKSEQE